MTPAIIAKVATTAEILSRVATRPTWADVSLGALRQNFRTVQKHVGANVTVCAIVKADAYGHGAHGHVRSHVLLHRTKVLPQRAQRDIGPGRTRRYSAQD